MLFQTLPLQGRNINQYSMYMMEQSASPQASANFHAEINNKPELGNLQKAKNVTECRACTNRKFVDVSNDTGVSFKSPTNVSPQASHSAVTSHEQEHVTREQAKAARNGHKVVSQSVQIYVDICPECGRAYTSGGKTTIVTKGESQKSDYFMDKINKFFEGHFGKKVDTYI